MFASRIGRVSNFCVIVTVLLSVPLLTGVCLGSMGNGPSLLVYESDYAELRARASQAPWGWMKNRAISSSGQGYGSIGGDDYNYVRDRMSSSALSYILDEPNQATYKDRIYDGIVNQLDKLDIGDSYDHAGTVKGANVLFVAINGLDLIYNDLTTTQQTNCWNTIQSKVNLISTSGYWPLARKGLHGTWKVFNNTCTQADCDAYYSEVMADFTSDGIFRGGSTYATARYLAADRYVKTLFMDVLEHTGIDNDNEYYDNPRIRAFQEWVYTATASPSHRVIPFGDSSPSGRLGIYQTPLYRAAKFGDTASGYASWFTVSDLPTSGLFSYVIPDQLYYDGKTMPASAAVKPKSKVYYHGGAWFWEDDTTEQSLMGALWTVTDMPSDEGHAHMESNAIYMAAYGEHVLLNAGYHSPYGSSWNDYSWNWFHNNAKSANTVVVNNGNHSSKAGGGLEEGFTSHGFDYACGNDGPALWNDTHLRSFIFVKPQDGKNGYFVLFDEVDADPGETVNVLLHPNTKATTGIETTTDRQEYQATIDGVVFDGNTDVKLSIFYGTTPTSVTKENGAIGNAGNTFETKYLNAQYGTDSSGNVQVATVLFPHNDTHAKATMTRLSGTGYNGASADHGDSVVDYVLASDGATSVTCEGVSFRAKSAVFRKFGEGLGFYFVRDGWAFSDGDVGFEADSSDITIHMDEFLGMIRSDGTEMKFLHPGLQGVLLNGESLSPVASGDGWMSVYVAAGTHDLEFVVTPEPASAALLLVGALGILRRRKRKR